MNGRTGAVTFAILAAALAGTGAWRHAGRPSGLGAAQAQEAASGPATLTRLWAQPVTAFHTAALSPDGSAIAVLSQDHQKLSFWNWKTRPEHPLWSRPLPDASSLTVSAGARTVLACTPLDPTDLQVVFLHGQTGGLLAKTTLDGAIWATRFTADGRTAAITTGNQSLFFYTLGAKTPPHRWALGGIGNTLDFVDHGRELTIGTWDQSGVRRFTSDGVLTGEYPVDSSGSPNRLFEAQAIRDGQCVLGLSYANARQSDGRLYFWRGASPRQPIWTYELGPDEYSPRVQASADGAVVALGYTRLIQRGDQSLPEQRLRLLDNTGDVLWEKGGLLAPLQLVALAPDAHRVTVSDGRRTLYNLDLNGRIVNSYRFGGLIRQAVPSEDGRSLLVYSGDGLLSLLSLG